MKRIIFVLLVAAVHPVMAQSIHKCRDVNGSISFQQSACSGTQRPDSFTGKGGIATMNSSESMSQINSYLNMKARDHAAARAQQSADMAESSATEASIRRDRALEDGARNSRIQANSLNTNARTRRALTLQANQMDAARAGVVLPSTEESPRLAVHPSIPVNTPEAAPIIERHSFVDASGNTFQKKDDGYYSATGGGMYKKTGSDNVFFNPSSGKYCSQQAGNMACR